MYKIKGDFVVRVSDGAMIPKDLMNKDYNDYLLWSSNGNVAANEPVLSENDEKNIAIKKLESSITDRMWREDAMGSSVIMDFGSSDPRTGKTATEYIAWVDSEISLIRGAGTT